MVLDLKTKFSSLKMNNITVIELKAIAKQCDIEGYYKLRKAELINKFEALSEINKQVLIPELKIPRNTQDLWIPAQFLISQFWTITRQY